jgi:hypothetical protein
MPQPGKRVDIPIVRTVVDGGLLLIILLSMLVRRPFTLQYAREQVSAVVQGSPTFIKTNYIITSIWALAMAILVIALSPCTSCDVAYLIGDRRDPCRARRCILVHQVVSRATKKSKKGAS